MAEDKKIIEILAKGNNSSTTDENLIKLYMHHHNMVICTQYQFNEIPSFAY